MNLNIKRTEPITNKFGIAFPPPIGPSKKLASFTIKIKYHLKSFLLYLDSVETSQTSKKKKRVNTNY